MGEFVEKYLFSFTDNYVFVREKKSSYTRDDQVKKPYNTDK